MVGIKRFKLVLGIFIPFLLFSLMSQNTFAEAQTYYYDTARVNFYTNSQHNADVSLPWSANPGSNKFWLNNVFVDNQVFADKNLSYLSGRGVLEIRNIGVLSNGTIVSSDIFVCGFNSAQLAYSINNNKNNQCLGSITVVYTDGTNTKVIDQPATFSWNNSTRNALIFFDYSLSTDSTKVVDFIQFRFYATSGNDILSRTTNWVNQNLFSMYNVRTSIDAYVAPADGSGISNDLLQQQIGQNQTIIEQDSNYYNHEYEAESNISNQSSNDIDGATNQQTTSLINVISGFISAFSGISATNCNLTLDFPDFAGGSRIVNICSGKEKAPRIIEIGSSLLLIGVFVPLAYILIKMIYNEIRSWTNG